MSMAAALPINGYVATATDMSRFALLKAVQARALETSPTKLGSSESLLTLTLFGSFPCLPFAADVRSLCFQIVRS